MTERLPLALDVNNWQARQRSQIVDDFAGALLENQEASLEDRINTFSISLEELKRMRLRNETPQDELENAAVKGLISWAEENIEGQAFWISPPSSSYSESRFIIYSLESFGDQKIITFRAICGKETINDCLAIAEQIAAFSTVGLPEFAGSDDLRRITIPFHYRGYQSWVGLMEAVFGQSPVWEKIKSGADLTEHEKAKEVAERVIDRHLEYIFLTKGRYEQIVLGATLEEEAARAGFKMQLTGSCGISNTLLLSKEQTLSPFNTLFSGHTEHTKHFDCPRCKGPIPSGLGITVCPHCGAKKEDYRKCD
jgi:hypothetical protein